MQEAPDPGTPTPWLSVVIPTLGRPSIDEQLAALEACSWVHPWEIVVSDNSPEGAALAVVERWREVLPNLRYVAAPDRRSRSHAVNRGVDAAVGRWLLFVDDDDIVEPDIVSAVGDAFVAGARAVSFNMNLREVNPPHVWESYPGAAEIESSRPMIRHVPALWGCAAIERALFLELGGYDESRLRAQDLDLSIRLHERGGVEPTWLPRQLVHYRLRGDVRGRFKQRVAHTEAFQAIVREHPELAPEASPHRWRRLVIDTARLAPLLPGVLRPAGRLQLADRGGAVWGRFTAAGRRR